MRGGHVRIAVPYLFNAVPVGFGQVKAAGSCP